MRHHIWTDPHSQPIASATSLMLDNTLEWKVKPIWWVLQCSQLCERWKKMKVIVDSALLLLRQLRTGLNVYDLLLFFEKVRKIPKFTFHIRLPVISSFYRFLILQNMQIFKTSPTFHRKSICTFSIVIWSFPEKTSWQSCCFS